MVFADISLVKESHMANPSQCEKKLYMNIDTRTHDAVKTIFVRVYINFKDQVQDKVAKKMGRGQLECW